MGIVRAQLRGGGYVCVLDRKWTVRCGGRITRAGKLSPHQLPLWGGSEMGTRTDSRCLRAILKSNVLAMGCWRSAAYHREE